MREKNIFNVFVSAWSKTAVLHLFNKVDLITKLRTQRGHFTMEALSLFQYSVYYKAITLKETLVSKRYIFFTLCEKKTLKIDCKI